MSDEESVDGAFIVERIVDKRLKNGKIEYCLKWRGCPNSENTWELEEILGCAHLIADYEQSIKPKKSEPKKRSSPTLSSDAENKRKQTERQQAERKEAERKEAEQKQAEQKEAERKEAEQKQAEQKQAEDNAIGFDRGLEPLKILGATDTSGELMFLLKWKGSDRGDLVTAKEARVKCPQVVIQFYEKRLVLDTSSSEEDTLSADESDADD